MYIHNSAGNKTPIHEPVTSHACLPYELPVAMPQGIVSDVLWAGIDDGIKHHSHYYMQGIDYASVQSEPLTGVCSHFRCFLMQNEMT